MPLTGKAQVQVRSGNGSGSGNGDSTWLQQLNNYKQHYRVTMDWLDWQTPDFLWTSQLVVAGTVTVRSSGARKKQAAREGAARMFLESAAGNRGQ